jgi:hypothetical protein
MCNFRTNRFSDSEVVTEIPAKLNRYNTFAVIIPTIKGHSMGSDRDLPAYKLPTNTEIAYL